jgi:hypothetical protein
MSEIHSVLFDINKWTTAKARAWLKKENLKPIKKVHKQENFLRYRLHDPSKYKRFITKKLDNGIDLVIGFK